MKQGSWKVSELVGCDVFDASGEKLGVMADVLPSGANDIWVVVDPSGRGAELLLPALKSVVKEVDTAARKIVVEVPAGLREIYAAPGKEDGKPGTFED